jgi:hypothetical protein
MTTCANYEGTKLICKSLEQGTVLHLICPSEIHWSKFIVDVLYRPSLAHSEISRATRPSLTRLKMTSLNFPHLKVNEKDSSNICGNAADPEGVL